MDNLTNPAPYLPDIAEHQYEAPWETVDYWTQANTFLSLILVVILPIIYFHFSKHLIVAIRVPIVCVMEIVTLMCLLFTISSQYSPFGLENVWINTSCLWYNNLAFSTNAIIFNIMIARIVLFYRLAQTSNLTIRQPGFLDSLIFYIGWLNAPEEFNVLERRLDFITKMSDDVTSISTSFTVETDGEFLDSMSSKKKSNFLWIVKLALWFCFWTILSISIDYFYDRDHWSQVGTTECGAGIFYIIGVFLITWNLLQLCLVISLRYIIKSDRLGLTVELQICQGILTLSWGLSGVLQLWFTDTYGTFGIYCDLLAMLLHALLTFFYPLILVARKNREIESQIMKNLSSNIEEIWKDSVGKNIIIQVSKENFAIENPLFLFDTDNLDNICPAKYMAIYRKFISRNSPFELNLPILLIKNVNSAISTKSYDIRTFIEIRTEIFKILSSNFMLQIKEKMEKTISRSKSTRLLTKDSSSYSLNKV